MTRKRALLIAHIVASYIYSIADRVHLVYQVRPFLPPEAVLLNWGSLLGVVLAPLAAPVSMALGIWMSAYSSLRLTYLLLRLSEYFIPFFFLFALFMFRSRRASRRQQIGLCHVCGYNLTANTSGVCPECGTPVSQKSEAVA